VVMTILFPGRHGARTAAKPSGVSIVAMSIDACTLSPEGGSADNVFVIVLEVS
jgi:hypothetical protein